MPTPTPRPAFTLIEMLVVMTIVATLIALLIPAIAKAKAAAMESVCITRVRGQHAAQAQYATDFKDRFAEHTDPFPMYVKSPGNVPNNSNIWHAMGPIHPTTGKTRDSYINNGKLLTCPFASGFTGAFEDPYWQFNYGGSFGIYGAWNSPASSNYVSIGYLWFANFKVNQTTTQGLFGTLAYLNNEPAWAVRLSDGTSENAFITHQIFQDSMVPGWDLSHGMVGTNRFLSTTGYRGGNTPVGFGDGHAVIRTPRDIRARVQSIQSGRVDTYWY